MWRKGRCRYCSSDEVIHRRGAETIVAEAEIELDESREAVRTGFITAILEVKQLFITSSAY